MEGIQYGTRTTRSNSNSGSAPTAATSLNLHGGAASDNSNDSASTSVAQEAAGPICANCSTQTTSLWRRSAEGQTLCNACSLYQKMKGTPRPVSLKSDTIKHRNRSKGEKKARDPTQGGKGSGKGKKSAGGARGASANRASKQSSPAMGDVPEVDDEAYESQEELLGVDSGNTSTASMHDALLVSQVNARHARKSPATDQAPDAHQAPGQSEYAAAAALANASASANANANSRRSVSVDGREPASHRSLSQQNMHIPSLGLNPYNPYTHPSVTSNSLLNGYTLGHQSMIPPVFHPGYRTDIKNIYPYPQQSVDAMNAMYFPSYRDLGNSLSSGQTKSTSPSTATSRNNSPLQMNSQPPPPAMRQSSKSRQSSPQNQDLQGASAPASQHVQPQSSSQYTSTPGVPSSAGPHRSASLDRYGMRYLAAVNRPLEQSEETRNRQKSTTDKLDSRYNGQEQDSLTGRSSATQTGSPAFRPYNLPLQRSQQRGLQNCSDSRTSATFSGRTSPGTFKQGRPGSSASSSSSSNDDKKGPASIYSPPFHPSISPNLPPIADAMVIDEEEAEAAPVFGQPTRQSSSAERRGRSTTRKTRESDTVAYGLSALRVRSSSRGDDDDRTQSPPFTKLTHSSIMVGDLDDGIVRNAATHRPISDMRDSASPATTTLPSLSSALSSTNSSRSVSGSRSTSRQSRKVPHISQSSSTAPLLPPPNTGYEEVARLRTRIQELEFINSLLENRVAELEASKTPPVHSPSCTCRCTQSMMDEDARASERFKEELASHGIQGLGDKQNKELFDLLHQRLGYQPGDLSK